MSTRTLPGTRRPGDNPGLSPADAVNVDGLVVEIERYLAARTRTTAHPLVTKTTNELVSEALATLDAAPVPAPTTSAAPRLAPPSALLRRLPDWVLSLPVLRSWHGGGRHITAAEHLELTALTIERFGWVQGRECDDQGRRCILGAQLALMRLGYGDLDTLHRATTYLCREAGGSYEIWNDQEGRTRTEVLDLIRRAAATAREDAR